MRRKLVLALTAERGRHFVRSLGLSEKECWIVTPHSVNRGRGLAVHPEDVIWVDYPLRFSDEFHITLRPCILETAGDNG